MRCAMRMPSINWRPDCRLLDFDGASVQLNNKDYRDGDRRKVMTLTAEELIRRFLLHALPKGFMRVRHFGFLAKRRRARRLTEIRTALSAPPAQSARAGNAGDAVRWLSLSHVPNREAACARTSPRRVVQRGKIAPTHALTWA